MFRGTVPLTSFVLLLLLAALSQTVLCQGVEPYAAFVLKNVPNQEEHFEECNHETEENDEGELPEINLKQISKFSFQDDSSESVQKYSKKKHQKSRNRKKKIVKNRGRSKMKHHTWEINESPMFPINSNEPLVPGCSTQKCFGKHVNNNLGSKKSKPPIYFSQTNSQTVQKRPTVDKYPGDKTIKSSIFSYDYDDKYINNWYTDIKSIEPIFSFKPNEVITIKLLLLQPQFPEHKNMKNPLYPFYSSTNYWSLINDPTFREFDGQVSTPNCILNDKLKIFHYKYPEDLRANEGIPNWLFTNTKTKKASSYNKQYATSFIPYTPQVPTDNKGYTSYWLRQTKYPETKFRVPPIQFTEPKLNFKDKSPLKSDEIKTFKSKRNKNDDCDGSIECLKHHEDFTSTEDSKDDNKNYGPKISSPDDSKETTIVTISDYELGVPSKRVATNLIIKNDKDIQNKTARVPTDKASASNVGKKLSPDDNMNFDPKTSGPDGSKETTIVTVSDYELDIPSKRAATKLIIKNDKDIQNMTKKVSQKDSASNVDKKLSPDDERNFGTKTNALDESKETLIVTISDSDTETDISSRRTATNLIIKNDEEIQNTTKKDHAISEDKQLSSNDNKNYEHKKYRRANSEETYYISSPDSLTFHPTRRTSINLQDATNYLKKILNQPISSDETESDELMWPPYRHKHVKYITPSPKDTKPVQDFSTEHVTEDIKKYIPGITNKPNTISPEKIYNHFDQKKDLITIIANDASMTSCETHNKRQICVPVGESNVDYPEDHRIFQDGMKLYKCTGNIIQTPNRGVVCENNLLIEIFKPCNRFSMWDDVVCLGQNALLICNQYSQCVCTGGIDSILVRTTNHQAFCGTIWNTKRRRKI